MGVGFVHGSNDGQKGIGLIMLVLIGIVPANFVLDTTSTTYQIERTRDAANHLSVFYQRNEAMLGDFLALKRSDANTELPRNFRCDPELTMPTIAALHTALAGVSNYADLSSEKRFDVCPPANAPTCNACAPT
ncbi:hypothetical protein G6F50_016595 [Rhizopus delemar]|uniref:Uncharacterized protein n=1 Tax=Rhizopus delemar TaxID=936053 RepID=A0A9P6XT37_9FUNG|nr:hypothetical protein G6F50_016595 [Rhizopus delemar]